MNTHNLKVAKLKNPTFREISQIKSLERNCGLSEWSAVHYQEETRKKDSIFLIGKSEDQIVAFLIARVNRISEEEKSEADILNFGVLKELQNQGIGDCLFQALVNNHLKKDFGTIWLEVRKSNENALKFYLRRNFKIIQTRKSFYSNPVEDALVMKLEL